MHVLCQLSLALRLMTMQELTRLRHPSLHTLRRLTMLLPCRLTSLAMRGVTLTLTMMQVQTSRLVTIQELT